MENTNHKLTDLEREVLKYFLERNSIDKEYFGKDLEDLKVTNREMTGVGFFTYVSTTKSFRETRLESLRWGGTRATLNDNLDVGFLIYIDNYTLTTIEGYTYGSTVWPELITSFTIRDLNKDEF